MARVVPARLIILKIERQMRDKWKSLHYPRLTSGEKDEIYDNANTMKNDKLKIGLWGYFTSLLANLSIFQNGRKRQT